MTDENETKLVNFKLPEFFRSQLAKKMKSTRRTATEIVISSVCKVEKFKLPKGHKFVKPFNTKYEDKK